jgi:hypothetical protein
MALTYDQISAVTQKHYVRKMVDNIFDSDPLLQRAKEKGWYTSINGGTSIMQPLAYALTTAAGSYNPTDTLNTTDNDQFSSADYSWKFYYANISISRADELKNSGDAAILQFVKEKVKMAEMSLKDSLQDGLYSAGSSSSDIGGLRLIVDSANTVGGIAQGSYSWWQSQEDSSTTTLTLDALQSQFNTLSIGGKHPSVIMATRANYNRLYALLQPQQRFTDAKTASAGFQSLLFNGVPFIAGSKVPSGHIFMLNEEFLHLYYHPQEDMRFEPFSKPVNQNVKLAKIYWAGNLGTSNARMQGKFTAITA